MTDQVDFEKVAAKLSVLSRKEIRKLDMPVDQAIKEGQLMASAAAEDREKLTAIGLDRAKIDELGAAVGALSFSQGRYVAAMGEMKEAALQWVEEEPAALELRREILAAASYALRNVPDAAKALKDIRQGSGSQDAIQDLVDLSQLGRKYRKQFEAINFDVKLLDTAEEKGSSLRKLLSQGSLEKNTAGAKDTRDRAFTYMRMLMGDILDAAEYALRRDRQRLDFYHSTYRSRHDGAAEPAAKATAQTAEVAAK